MIRLLILLLWFSPWIACLEVFQPTNYNVLLDFRDVFENSKQETFSGQSNITGIVQKQSDRFRLHAWRMDFNNSSLECKNEIVNIKEVNHTKFAQDFVTIVVDRNLTVGEKCIFRTNYTAVMRNLYGLYRSYFPSKFSKSPTTSLVTSNEDRIARLWTPCLDNLDEKANWTMTIRHPKDTRVVAISPVFQKNDEDHRKSRFITTYPVQMNKINFAVFNQTKFRSDSITASSNQTIRYWLPRGIVFKMKIKEILAETREYFDYLVDVFNYTIPCKNIEIIFMQHNMGVSSGCLVVVDHRHLVTMRNIRSLIGQLWLGSVVRFEDTRDAWFPYSLSHYLAYSYKNNDTHSNIFNLQNAIHNDIILQDPLVSHFMQGWQARHLYGDKGLMLVRMMADLLDENTFREVVNKLANNKITNMDVVNMFMKATSKANRPGCYRAFMGTQTDFIGVPVLTVTVSEGGLNISQHNFEVTDRKDPRHRDWTFLSQWAVPVYFEINGTNHRMWFHQDDGSVFIDTSNETVIIDPDVKGLYLVEYTDQVVLLDMWNKIQDCSKFDRLCVEATINTDFCNDVYHKNCLFPSESITAVTLGTKHKWDE